jgi:hypothetical protein
VGELGGNAKAGEFHCVGVWLNQDIRRLEVVVNDAMAVNFRNGEGKLDCAG